MGLSSRLAADARHRAEPDRRDDRRGTAERRPGLAAAAGLIALILAAPAEAETLRAAVYAAPLSREGPGLLLRDLIEADAPDLEAIIGVIAETRPDILLLTDIDWDAGGAAIAALQERLASAGLDLPHALAPMPNTGMPTGRDLDGNGRLGEPRDAQGYGRFAGDGGLALLSRFPLDAAGLRDFSDLLWQDLPGATLPEGEASADLQRLSSTGHWTVPVELPDGPATLLVWSATPPVFDGPEDRNGLRNRDEARLWPLLIDGELGPPPEGRLLLMGNSNLDPADGTGRREAMADLLAHPRLQDPRPASAGAAAAADPGQSGDPALDTADWDPPAGNLRVAYVLPSSDWTVAGSGVFWPARDDPRAALLGEDGQAAGAHRLVWVDLELGD